MSTIAERIKAQNQTYTEAFKSGVRAAANAVTRSQANSMANRLAVRDGDAFLAGYYAELRRQRA